MNTEYTNQEINWKTKTEYVDIDTGEIISKDEATRAYIITKKNKHATVYKKTGTITWTYECKTSKQGRLFE